MSLTNILQKIAVTTYLAESALGMYFMATYVVGKDKFDLAYAIGAYTLSTFTFGYLYFSNQPKGGDK